MNEANFVSPSVSVTVADAEQTHPTNRGKPCGKPEWKRWRQRRQLSWLPLCCLAIGTACTAWSWTACLAPKEKRSSSFSLSPQSAATEMTRILIENFKNTKDALNSYLFQFRISFQLFFSILKNVTNWHQTIDFCFNGFFLLCSKIGRSETSSQREVSVL